AVPVDADGSTDWAILRIEEVRVAASRPDGAGTWDGAKRERNECVLVGGAATLAGTVLGRPEAGPIASTLCSYLLPTEQKERDPRAPDLLLRLSAEGAKNYFSYVAPDSFAHDFAYEFLVPVAGLPPGGLKLAVIDRDGSSQ